MNVISAETTPNLYVECLIRLPMIGRLEPSRNGEVLAASGPVCLTLFDPTKRVLYDPVRKANPYFHVMEFVWMMAGSDNVKWIEQFNSGYRNYAEPGTDSVWAAYGKRWLDHFPTIGPNDEFGDQISLIVQMLKDDSSTRRAVLSMWDPTFDLEPHNDLPCNTHIYFRVRNEKVHGYGMQLDMTVCNRSNDLIWGALGANVVHMTFLHELIALAAGYDIGTYRVLSNNLHVYTGMPRYEEIMRERWSPNPCHGRMKLLNEKETLADFLHDAQDFLTNTDDQRWAVYRTGWFTDVAQPMYFAYMDRKAGLDGKRFVEQIKSEDWWAACRVWGEWHEK